MEHINPELLILIPVLNGIGFTVKKMGLNPKFIPGLLIFLGVAFAALYMASEVETLIENIYMGIIQGVLAALAATGVHQNCKQIKFKKAEYNNE